MVYLFLDALIPYYKWLIQMIFTNDLYNYWQALWRGCKVRGQEKLSYVSGQGEER